MKVLKKDILYLKEGFNPYFNNLIYEGIFFGNRGLEQTYSSYNLGLETFLNRLLIMIRENSNGSIMIKNENLSLQEEREIKKSLENKFPNKIISWLNDR